MSELRVPAARLRAPSWRDSRLLVGLLIVLVSVVLGARVVAAAGDTRPVFAAVSALPPGHALVAADLQVVGVHLGSGTAAYLSAGSRLPSGLVLTRAVGAGELLPVAAVGSADLLARRPVTIPMPAPLPAALVAGSSVDLWSSAKETDSGATGYRPPVRIAQGASVYAVTASSAGLGVATGDSVQVLLEESELRSVLDALANGGKVTVVPVPTGVSGTAATGAGPSGRSG